MTSPENLPVAVIGAGPVGLAAAAHLIQRGLPVKVYEAGETVAANVRDWGHVRLFSPWEYNTDTASCALLQSHGWQEPLGKAMPTGSDLYEAYLKPLAGTPEMAAVIETGVKVKAITRQGADKVLSKGRETKPFVLAALAQPRYRDPSRMLKILCCHGRAFVERVRDGFAPRPASCC